MPYDAEISRNNPSCFLFLIDQSGSMEEKIPSIGKSKAQFVADVLNKTLYQLVIRCSRAEGVRNYFEIGVLAYGGDAVRSGFGGALNTGIIHPLSAVADHPLRVEERTKTVDDGAGGFIKQNTKFPIWFEPVMSGGTPMCAAFRQATEIIVEWCDQHPESYPPTLINVTDGQSTDGVPESIAEQIKQIATQNGQCLVFNLHIDASEAEPLLFPVAESASPDPFSQMLCRMSSDIPPNLLPIARDYYPGILDHARFFAYKAGIEAVVNFFEIGTRASNLR
jgi:hypothetical protein